MDRGEAQAIYDSGRERCVDFILELVASVERLRATGELLEVRVRRLELADAGGFADELAAAVAGSAQITAAAAG